MCINPRPELPSIPESSPKLLQQDKMKLLPANNDHVDASASTSTPSLRPSPSPSQHTAATDISTPLQTNSTEMSVPTPASASSMEAQQASEALSQSTTLMPTIPSVRQNKRSHELENDDEDESNWTSVPLFRFGSLPRVAHSKTPDSTSSPSIPIAGSPISSLSSLICETTSIIDPGFTLSPSSESDPDGYDADIEGSKSGRQEGANATSQPSLISTQAMKDLEEDVVSARKRRDPPTEEQAPEEKAGALSTSIAKMLKTTRESSPESLSVSVPARVSQPTPSVEKCGPPLPIPCGHSIHPAYTLTYGYNMCPACLLEIFLRNLGIAQQIIAKQGGMSDWHERIKESGESEAVWRVAVRGGKNNRQLIDGQTRDISYRHQKRMFQNFVTELGRLSTSEKAFEESQSTENKIFADELQLLKPYGATAALLVVKKVMETDEVGFVEKDCAAFSRKRGRDWEVIADPGYPEWDDKAGDEEHYRWSSMCRDQRDFIRNSKVLHPRYADGPLLNGDSPPLRKRRRQDAKVSFNPDVYVRNDADIDILRKEATSPATDSVGRPAPAKPGPSILPTTRLRANTRPKRPHHIRPIRTFDGPALSSWITKADRHFEGPGDWAGIWVAAEGSETVNTSGSRMSVWSWETHVEDLQQEAAEMDSMDVDQDLEGATDVATAWEGSTEADTDSEDEKDQDQKPFLEPACEPTSEIILQRALEKESQLPQPMHAPRLDDYLIVDGKWCLRYDYDLAHGIT